MSTAGIKKVGEIEIDQNLEHLRREWRFQRIGWLLMLLVVLAALAGLFGRGPLAKASGGAPNAPARLEYERIVRYTSPTQLTVLLSPEAIEEGIARIWLEREYIQAVEIDRIVPEPEQEEAAEQQGVPGILYTVRVVGTGQPARVHFYIKPDHYGMQRGRIGLLDRSPVTFEQFVLP
jgi:hypothetical protein